jgi:hypothetical protein
VNDDGLFAGMSLDVDPKMPPGTVDLLSGDDRLRTLLPDVVRVRADALRQRAETDPEFAAELAEELASLAESRDYFTHPQKMTPPEKCEVCGTLVTFVPEAHTARRDSKREPALWEAGQWRKHTPRRCGAMRKDT